MKEYLFVVHQFIRGEGGNGVEEEGGSRFEVTDRHVVGSLVHLQSVPPVPVTTLIDQPGGKRRE